MYLKEEEYTHILQMFNYEQMATSPPDTADDVEKYEKKKLIEFDQKLAQTLIKQHIVYLDEAGEAKIDKHAHLIFNSIANADFFLKIHKNTDLPLQDETVYFYVYRKTLIYVKKYNNIYEMYWLPHIPMVIGGIASFLNKFHEQGFSITIEGEVSKEKDSNFGLTLLEKTPITEEIVHIVTRWFVYFYSSIVKERSTNE